MAHSNRQKRFCDSGLLQAALALLGMLILFWLRRRSMQQLREERPLTWRRDIEMGPAETVEAAEMHIIAPAEAPAIEIENVPEVSAGDGGTMEQSETEERAEASRQGWVDRATQPRPPATEKPAERAQPLQLESEPSEPGTAGGDDLKIIEGIGPKINRILQEAGIHTFADLASAEVTKLQTILRAAGLRSLNNPQSWPEQAKLAAEGEWSKLEALQKQLKGGRM